MAFTETWFVKNFSVYIIGYHIYRRDGTNQGYVGVCIYVKYDLSSCEVDVSLWKRSGRYPSFPFNPSVLFNRPAPSNQSVLFNRSIPFNPFVPLNPSVPFNPSLQFNPSVLSDPSVPFNPTVLYVRRKKNLLIFGENDSYSNQTTENDRNKESKTGQRKGGKNFNPSVPFNPSV